MVIIVDFTNTFCPLGPITADEQNLPVDFSDFIQKPLLQYQDEKSCVKIWFDKMEVTCYFVVCIRGGRMYY